MFASSGSSNLHIVIYNILYFSTRILQRRNLFLSPFCYMQIDDDFLMTGALMDINKNRLQSG